MLQVSNTGNNDGTNRPPATQCALSESSVLFTINGQSEGQQKKSETLAQLHWHVCLWTLSSSSHPELLLQLFGSFLSFYVSAELLLDSSQSLVTGELRLLQCLAFHAEVLFEIVHSAGDNNRHKLLFPLHESQSDCLRWSFYTLRGVWLLKSMMLRELLILKVRERHQRPPQFMLGSFRFVDMTRWSWNITHFVRLWVCVCQEPSLCVRQRVYLSTAPLIQVTVLILSWVPLVA